MEIEINREELIKKLRCIDTLLKSSTGRKMISEWLERDVPIGDSESEIEHSMTNEALKLAYDSTVAFLARVYVQAERKWAVMQTT